MRFTVAPIIQSWESDKCSANVLTDPADPRSPKAVCCKATPTWWVWEQEAGSKKYLACPRHLNILLNDLNQPATEGAPK